MEERMTTIREGGTGSISDQDVQPDFLPDRFEPGSHNAIGIIGLSEGVKWVLDQSIDKLARHDRALTCAFLEGVETIEGLTFFGPRGVKHRTGVFSVAIDGYDPAELAAILESHYGILTRPGLHCAPLAHEALGTAARGGTTRFSFGPFLSTQDIAYATDALAEIAASVPRHASKPANAAV
jgi:cysteine desulfurase / selenocysteine lyase